MSEPLTAEVRKAITDAYYDARNDGETMETAADNATKAVLATLDAARPSGGLDVATLIGELLESPLPGARYAVTVVRNWYARERARLAEGEKG